MRPELFIDYARRNPKSPELLGAAKRKVKAGPHAPGFYLTVAHRNLTGLLAEANVDFSATGESAMRFAVKKPLALKRWENAPVKLWIGYGKKLVPFFWGRLEEPKDSRSGLSSEASAYGLSHLLGRQRFGARVSYAGSSLAEFHRDLVRRTGELPGRFELRGGAEERVEADQEGYGLEATHLEAERAVLEPMGYLGYDDIGGQHVWAKKTRLSDAVTRKRLVGVFGEGEYPKDGFSFSQGFRNFYPRVVVFRRSEGYAQGGAAKAEGEGMVRAEDGSYVPRGFYGSAAESELSFGRPYATPTGTPREYAVYAERRVANRGPQLVNIYAGLKSFEKRPYVVPDFVGSQADAERECLDLVRAFSYGVGAFEFSCSPVDFGFGDAFGVTRIEKAAGKVYRVLYACVVDGAVNLAIRKGVFDMRVSGSAAERSRSLIGRSRRTKRRRSSGTRSSSTTPRPRGTLAGFPFSGGSPFLGKG